MGAPPAPGPTRSRPALWPAAAQYAAALAVGQVVGPLMFLAAVGLWRTRGHPADLDGEVAAFAQSRWGIAGASLVSAFSLCFVVTASARLERRPLLAVVRLGPTRATTAGSFAAVAGTCALSVAAGTASDLLGVRGHGNLELIAHALERPTIAQCAATLLAIAVAPGVAEEAFFRGLVQTRLLARWGAPRAVLVTAAAFGLLHLDVVQGSLAFLLGLFLGFVAERAGGIRPTIAAHTFNNALFVVSAAWGSDGSSRTGEIAAVGMGVLVCAASTGVLLTPFGIRPGPASGGQ